MSLPDARRRACNTWRVIVDVAVYEHGCRLDGVHSPREACDATHSSPDRFTWIGMSEPNADELEDVAKLYELHPLAVEDAVHAHQRPKLEQYDGSLVRGVEDPALRRSRRGLRARRGADLRRHRLCDHGSPRSGLRPRHDPPPARVRARAVGDRTGRGAARDRRPRRRSVRGSGRQHRDRHRRDPGPSVLRPERHARRADLPTQARGARVPSGGDTARRPDWTRSRTRRWR